MNPIFFFDLEKFKQEWCNRWMASYRIQKWWRKLFDHDKIKEEKEDYVRQVQSNYCHQLELLFYAVDKWGRNYRSSSESDVKDCHILIPIYLFEIPKMRELILAISAQNGWNFEVIPGTGSIYREKIINHYVATHKLLQINCFNSYGNRKVVFISRAASKKRRISNEQRLIDFLRPRIPKMEVYCFDDESSAIEQARLFRRCEVLIGLHGAGLANLLWMHSDAYVYEFTPNGYVFHNYHAKAHFRGFTHRYIHVEKYEKSEKSLVYPRDSILHISQDEMKRMAELMEIDGIAQKVEEQVFNPRILSNNIKISDKIDEATRRKLVEIPFPEPKGE